MGFQQEGERRPLTQEEMLKDLARLTGEDPNQEIKLIQPEDEVMKVIQRYGLGAMDIGPQIEFIAREAKISVETMKGIAPRLIDRLKKEKRRL